MELIILRMCLSEQEAKDTGILSAKVFDGLKGTGVAVLTTAYRLYVITNIEDPNPRKYSEIPGMFYLQ